MKPEQHRAIAKWHMEQADKHDNQEGYSCGCPVEHHKAKTNEEILQEMEVE